MDFAWNQEESKIENRDEMTKAIVLSVLGTEAQRVVTKIRNLGSKKEIDGSKMLEYFKHPFAVYLS